MSEVIGSVGIATAVATYVPQVVRLGREHLLRRGQQARRDREARQPVERRQRARLPLRRISASTTASLCSLSCAA
jgi:hypothetical protein